MAKICCIVFDKDYYNIAFKANTEKALSCITLHNANLAVVQHNIIIAEVLNVLKPLQDIDVDDFAFLHLELNGADDITAYFAVTLDRSLRRRDIELLAENNVYCYPVTDNFLFDTRSGLFKDLSVPYLLVKAQKIFYERRIAGKTI